MPSSFGGINTATLGLTAQQIALDTIGHNISNASTTGYSRQATNLVTTPAQTIYAGAGAVTLGTGVSVASITRARDSFIDQQYWQQSADKGYWQNQSDVLGKVEDVFHDTSTTGIQATLNKFWTSLQTLAADPNDSGARTNVRENANSFVELLQQDASTLQATANDLTSQISTQVTTINSLSKQIAALNKQIVTQEAGGVQPANDLRDQRDNLVDQLSAIGMVDVSEDSSGNYQVSMENAVLVNGQKSYDLAVQKSYDTVGGYTTSNVVTTDVPPQVLNFKSGLMGSLLQSRDQIKGYLGNLDKMAQYLLQDYNTQQKAGKDGFDHTGADVINFFGVTGTDYTAAANDPTTGNPPLSWLSQLTVNADLYTTNGVNYIAASDITATTPGSANGNNALALGNILLDPPAASSAALGSMSLPDYYSTIISSLGVQSQQAGAMNTNQGTLLDSTSNWRQSISGVSIDEEMSNMIKYQMAYGAAAKVLSTMDTMLDTLISAKASA